MLEKCESRPGGTQQHLGDYLVDRFAANLLVYTKSTAGFPLCLVTILSASEIASQHNDYRPYRSATGEKALYTVEVRNNGGKLEFSVGG